MISQILHGNGQFPAAAAWMGEIHRGLAATYLAYPFLAYCTDWLAFNHFVIAIFFIGPLLDPGATSGCSTPESSPAWTRKARSGVGGQNARPTPARKAWDARRPLGRNCRAAILAATPGSWRVKCGCLARCFFCASRKTFGRCAVPWHAHDATALSGFSASIAHATIDRGATSVSASEAKRENEEMLSLRSDHAGLRQAERPPTRARRKPS